MMTLMMTEEEVTNSYHHFNNSSIAYAMLSWCVLEIISLGTPGFTIGTALICIAYANSIYHIFYYDRLKHAALRVLWDERDKQKKIRQNKMRFEKALADAHEVQ